MKRNALLATAVVVLVAASFLGGAYLGPRVMGRVGGRTFFAGPGGFGDPMGQLTDDERAELQSMSDSERRAFMQRKFGAEGPRGAGGPGGSARDIVVEGAIAQLGPDQMTVATANGGSQALYYDDETVLAFARGSDSTELAQGAKVTAVVTAEADNVLSATVIVVK